MRKSYITLSIILFCSMLHPLVAQIQADNQDRDSLIIGIGAHTEFPTLIIHGDKVSGLTSQTYYGEISKWNDDATIHSVFFGVNTTVYSMLPRKYDWGVGYGIMRSSNTF